MQVYHECAWGCRGQFVPSRYNSSRAKCIKCHYCGVFFSPNKFVFHSHRLTDSDKYIQPDAANFNSWRRHTKLLGDPPEVIVYAWEDVKAMFNGGTRKRLFSESSSTVAPSTSSVTPTSTTPAPKSSKSSNKSPKTEPKPLKNQPFFNKKPDFLPATPAIPPVSTTLGYFPPFDSCLDTFAAAAAALNKEAEKPLKSGGGNGGSAANESSVGNSLGISDYGLWPHPVAPAAAPTNPPACPPAFPFPYSFFWPSKRPPTTMPFSPFHASILGNYVSRLMFVFYI